MRPHALCRAFTLIELLIVVAVIGILASMVLAVMSNVRSAARSVVCQNSVRQLGMASISYALDNRGLWPMSEWVINGKQEFWGLHISMYIKDFTGREIQVGLRPPVPFACPESIAVAENNAFGVLTEGTDYGKNMYAGGYSHGWPAFLAGISLSAYPTATTLGFADGSGGKTRTGDPGTRELAQYINWAPSWGMGFSRHRGRSNAVFLDGHVESMLEQSVHFTNNKQAPWNWPR